MVNSLRVSDELPEQERTHKGFGLEMLFSHVKKSSQLGSQIGASSLSALSIVYSRGNNEITNGMCPLVNSLLKHGKLKHPRLA